METSQLMQLLKQESPFIAEFDRSNSDIIEDEVLNAVDSISGESSNLTAPIQTAATNLSSSIVNSNESTEKPNMNSNDWLTASQVSQGYNLSLFTRTEPNSTRFPHQSGQTTGPVGPTNLSLVATPQDNQCFQVPMYDPMQFAQLKGLPSASSISQQQMDISNQVAAYYSGLDNRMFNQTEIVSKLQQPWPWPVSNNRDNPSNYYHEEQPVILPSWEHSGNSAFHPIVPNSCLKEQYTAPTYEEPTDSNNYHAQNNLKTSVYKKTRRTERKKHGRLHNFASNRPLSVKAYGVMANWFDEHFEYPYPRHEDKLEMAEEGGITLAQVNSWFANHRTRTCNTRPQKNRLLLFKSLTEYAFRLEQASHGVIQASEVENELKTIIESYL